MSALLADSGIEVLTLDDLPLGSDLFAELQRRLDTADVCIFLLSKDAASSPWIANEIGSAIAASVRKNMRILPALLDKDADIPPFLRSIKYVDLSDRRTFSRNSQELIRAVLADVEPAESRDFAREREAIEFGSAVVLGERKEYELLLAEAQLKLKREWLRTLVFLGTTLLVAVTALTLVLVVTNLGDLNIWQSVIVVLVALASGAGGLVSNQLVLRLRRRRGGGLND